jgi:hypothetical protein
VPVARRLEVAALKRHVPLTAEYSLEHHERKIFVDNVFDQLRDDAFQQSAAPLVRLAQDRVIGETLTASF